MSVQIINSIDITEQHTTHAAALLEAKRLAEICNACRYCEGFCAVFPAIAQRRSFDEPSLDYLANLCHNCTACYHACQYAPPHEFSINLPKALAELRAESYQKYAWPKPLGILFERNGLMVTLAIALSLMLIMFASILFQEPDNLFAQHQGAGAFYQVISHQVMVTFAATSFVFSALAIVMGFINFWRASKQPLRKLFKPKPLTKAIKAAVTLQYLGGGAGQGCNNHDASYANTRRYFHHAMAWGFMLCFAATVVATIYEYGYGVISPFPVFSVPVILGSIGGIGLIVGPVGLLWLKIIADHRTQAIKQLGMDYAFLLLLLLISITGFLLLGFRSGSAMGILLTIHLGFVFALFVILPYSKFVHASYRLAALIRYYLEHEQAK